MAAFHNRVVWITGASSGIGEALAYEFSRQGADLVLSARREPELARVAAGCQGPGKVMVLPFDMLQTAHFPTLTGQVLEQMGKVDVLVNNAGMSQRSLTRDTQPEVDRKLMEVNFFAQIALTKAVLPGMLAHKNGHFVVLSSLTGKFGYPYRSAYAASKHALEGFFESLFLEEQRNGIRVTIANPGGIRTAISLNAITGDGNAYGKMDELQDKGLSPEACARIIVQAAAKEKFEIGIGNGKEKLALWLKRLAPAVLRKMARL